MQDLTKDISLYSSLILDNENLLVERTIRNTAVYGYTKNNLSINSDCILSINILTGSLIEAAKFYNFSIPFMNNDKPATDDPLTKFCSILAEKSRKEVNSLFFMIQLLKSFKLSYSDLIFESDLEGSLKEYFLFFTNYCFDKIEITLIKEWSSFSEGEMLKETKKLKNEQVKYLSVFQSFYSPLIILDNDNKIMNFNLAAYHLFNELKAGEKIFNKNDKENEIDELLNGFVKSSLNELTYETFIETNQGKRFFLIKIKKLTDINNFYATILILDDLTERKEIEKQFEIAKTRAEEADRLKTAFLANMSHEIRTPMNAIIGFSDLLLMGDIDKDKKEYLELIQKSGNLLLKLIDDIIDVAKIESKQLKISISDCDIHEILNELFLLFDELIKKENKTNVKLNLTLPSNNLILKTDPIRLKQVLTNFLSNAIKFTHDGYIELGYKKIDPRNVVFYVKDTGIGIPKDKQNLIFERFYQLEEFYSKNQGGTGLGLAISKNIASLLGGSVWVESEPGFGSTFYFILPAKPGTLKYKTGAIKKFVHKEDKLKSMWKNRTILIAEDEEINFHYLKEILKNTGAKIIWAKNGLEAINFAEAINDIDIVLMDIKMPEINGLKAIKYIKLIKPYLPIIAQTAFVSANDKDICLKAGCEDFLSKPIKAGVLISVIEKIFQRTLSASK